MINKEFTDWINDLRKALSKPLPGKAAHEKLMPETRKRELMTNYVKKARKSAVLLLLYPMEGAPAFVLIKRAADGGVHSNQIAFPGGSFEPQDKTLQQTALRESQEETGIYADEVTVIGKLSALYIPPSNFMVTPFAGYLNRQPRFVPNNEVERIMEISLKELTDPRSFQFKTIKHRTGNEYSVPCFYLQNEIVWGATAMMLNEFLTIVKGMGRH